MEPTVIIRIPVSHPPFREIKKETDTEALSVCAAPPSTQGEQKPARPVQRDSAASQMPFN